MQSIYTDIPADYWGKHLVVSCNYWFWVMEWVLPQVNYIMLHGSKHMKFSNYRPIILFYTAFTICLLFNMDQLYLLVERTKFDDHVVV